MSNFLKLKESKPITPAQVKAGSRHFAVYFSFYKNIFSKINSKTRLEQVYKRALTQAHKPAIKQALTFFYRIRRDELLGNFSWNDV